MATATKSVKVPLKTRLKIWWEGYDPEDVRARLAELERRRAGSDEEEAASVPETDQSRAAPPTVEDMLPTGEWDRRRIEISQFIWGEGYCGPGGPEHTIGLSKLLALSPKMSALVVGAGLGGPARVLAKEFGVWITGIEASEKLAEAGMELSIREGMAKKAPIRSFDPENPEEFERSFDRAFAKEALHTVQNKEGLIREISAKLKEDGLFLITDFFLSEAGAALSPEVEAWREAQPLPTYLCPAENMIEMLEGAGMGVRVNESISDQYIAMINQAWADAEKVAARLMEQGEEGRHLIKVLMDEAEHWSGLSKLLESGALDLRRILANKKPTKTLSDW